MKQWWKSSTIWFNVLYVLVIIAGYWGFNDFAPDPEFATLVQAVVNILLRFKTSIGVSVK